MAIPLLATKVHIPRPRPELVLRPRLSARLDEGQTRQLTVISTPAGFGKTTLVSAWAAGRNSVAWLSLDEGDNDPVRFLAHLFAALQMVEDALGRDALAALQSSQPPSLEELLVGLLNQLSAFPTPCTLVLDDYHLIEAAAIHNLLTFILEHQPLQLHLVLAARADPPLPLARLRAAGQLTELRLRDLRFTPAEAAEFLDRVVGPSLTAEAAQILTTRAEGWAAGLQMAAVSIQNRDTAAIDRFIRSFTGTSHFVLDYLAEEVLQRQPPAIQSFLLRTSILERLNGPLCDDLLNPESPEPVFSQTILEQLEHANLFLIPLDDEQRWYRYHQLFSDLLRHRLQQTEPELKPVLCRRASTWHAQNGLTDEAISYALAASDFERAIGLVEQVAERTLMHGEVATFLSWMNKLPDRLVRTRPALCVYHAWALLLHGYPLEAIEVRLRAAEGEAGRATSLRAFMAMFQGEVAQAATLSRQALEQLPKAEAFLRGVAALTLGMAYLTDNEVAAGQKALQEATRISQQTGNVLVGVIVLCSLAELCRKQGQLRQAHLLYQQALEQATDEQGRRWPVAGRALIGLGDLLREWNQLDAAASLLTEGITLALRWGLSGALGGYLTLARTRQAQGQGAEARAIIQQAQSLVHRSNLPGFSDLAVDLYDAWLSLAQGDLAPARRWAEQRGGGLKVDPAELEQRHDYVNYHLRKYEYPVLARLWLADGHTAQALTLLDKALPIVERTKRPALVIEYHLLRALAHQSMGQTPEAQLILTQALALAEPEGYVRLIADEGERLRPLLADFHPGTNNRALRLKAYAERLLAALGQPAPTLPQPSKPPALRSRLLTEPLSDRELEVLRLLGTSLTATEIAAELTVAVSTIRSHTKSIYGKLGVGSRLEALERARELDLL